MSSCFSASSGTLRKNKGFVFGSTDGAIEFPEEPVFPSTSTPHDTQRFSDILSDSLSRQYEFPLEGKHQPDRPVKAEI